MHPYFLSLSTKTLLFLNQFPYFTDYKKTGRKPDVVWLFDIGNSLPLKYFPPGKKIYMPVDGPFKQSEKDATEGAELIISVTNEILEQYRDLSLPKYSINHGVAGIFINNNIPTEQNRPLHIGYSGSLVRSDLDIPVFLEIINRHPDKIFEFWGEKITENRIYTCRRM